jgi:hypothetical protein
MMWNVIFVFISQEKTGYWIEVCRRAGVNKFFRAQLLIHFTEALSTSALAHVVGVLWFDNIWPNYDPLLVFLFRIYSEQFLLCDTTPTFLKEFWPNFHRSFAIKCPGTHYRGLWFDNFRPNYGPFFPFMDYIVNNSLCAQLLL